MIASEKHLCRSRTIGDGLTMRERMSEKSRHTPCEFTKKEK